MQLAGVPALYNPGACGHTIMEGAGKMEINDKSRNHGFIEVWLDREEQQVCDRAELTKQLLANTNVKRCKVVFLLSGSEELFPNTEGLILANLRSR